MPDAPDMPDTSHMPGMPDATRTLNAPHAPGAPGLISVILPVYNAEPHLRASLDSIIAQTHQELELICINDGSTDGSLKILHEYAAHDHRIIVIDQANLGAGAARNRGLGLAHGSYLSFLDADDIFLPTMLAEAYQACQRNNADFCLFGSAEYITELDKLYKTPETVNKKLLPSKLDAFSFRDIKEDHFNAMLGWAWDKLFKAEFVRAQNLVFLEQHNSEDLFFVYSALVTAERMTVVDKVLAHHRMSQKESLSVSRANRPLDFYQSLIAFSWFLKAQGLYDELERSFVTYALNYSLWNLNTLPGAAFESTYNMLKKTGLTNLGLIDQPREYFFKPDDYDSWQQILAGEPIDFLQYKLNNLRGMLDALIRKLPFGLGPIAARWYLGRRSG